MTTEQRIEKYFTDRIEKYENELMKAIETILGPTFKELWPKKISTYFIVLTAGKEGLEYHLTQPLENNQRQVIEELLVKILQQNSESMISGENPKLLINKGYPAAREDNYYNEWLKGPNRKFLQTYDHKSQRTCSWVKIDIFERFRDGFYLDISYIFDLLIHYVNEYKGNQFYQPDKTFKVDCEIEKANEKIYLRIINTISIQIVSLLRQKNIYLFEEPSEMNEIIEGKYKMVSPKFISAFQVLIPLFLIDPQKFIDIVGKDNFRDFTICTLDANSELDIDEIIDRMIKEREKHITYEISSLNLPLLLNEKKRKEEQEEKTQQETEKRVIKQNSSLKRDPHFSNLFINDIYNIKKENNIKKIPTNKYNKIFPIDTREKYFNPDDLPPRR